MIKRNLIIATFIFVSVLPSAAQVKKEPVLKREVTLYNPYKPSLQESRKISFFPDMSDTSKVRPIFHYNVSAEPFMPEYTISPIKAASLLPEPLPKLYKSYLDVGLGNYLSPLAEISITNERSKKGNIGFYGRHYSTNGKIELPNFHKVFAGYMDNDASLFGRKFFRKSLLEGSVDFAQRTRYAYGYDPAIIDYSPSKKDIRIGYDNIGAKASLSSLTLDSVSFSYKFDLRYNYFYTSGNLNQKNFGFNGIMAKSYKEFYVGSGLSYDLYSIPDNLLSNNKYIASISPFVKKTGDQWNFKLGIQAMLERNMTSSAVLHFYPDFNFGFNVVPKYIRFFAGLSGKLEVNDPLKITAENPFLLSNGSLFILPNTDHQLIINAGLKGNTGMDGNYLVSASYSIVKNMLFFSNIVLPDSVFSQGHGNYFYALPDDVDLLNIHGEMNGKINDKLSFHGEANLYQYTLTVSEYAWNKPQWDGKFGLKYNLRDKILAGIELTGQGMRHEVVNGYLSPAAESLGDPLTPGTRVQLDIPAHINLNLSAEYRYSKILSFWAKLNNISTNSYYEWAYYPTQGFMFMVGFTYSL
jgi:hypothetical protein